MSELADFRAQKDEFFQNHVDSPLSAAQKEVFNGLIYFPEDQSLNLIVEIQEFPEYQEMQIPTNTGQIQTYERFGRFQFQVEGQLAELTVFRAGYSFFLPFTDALSGVETYGAGRYLEPIELADGRFRVDFNFAYNPYCAYNPHWACPLTPAENRLSIPIRAGEKIPTGDWIALE